MVKGNNIIIRVVRNNNLDELFSLLSDIESI